MSGSRGKAEGPQELFPQRGGSVVATAIEGREQDKDLDLATGGGW